MTTTTNPYQCAIVGGGLAGLCLSIQLAKSGIAVALFEKEKYPFHKVCGEYISLESFGFLESMGLNLTALQLPTIKNLAVSAPNGNKLQVKLPLGGFGISRYKLDNLLVEIAKKHGVAVFDGVKVTDIITLQNNYVINTTSGTFYAQLVAGSWGKRSNLDVQLKRGFINPKNRKLNNYIGVKYHVKSDLPDDLIELHNFENGYCGISKIEDNKYCMCYLVHGDMLKRAGGSIPKMEEMYLYKNPFLRDYFTRFPKLYDAPLAISQISFEPKETVVNNIFMLGDAAGLITPLCGNGMSMAMHASKLLYNQLLAVFYKKQTIADAKHIYNQQWQKQFATRLKTGRLIQSLFGKPFATNALINTFKKIPFATRQLIKLTHGKPF
jgi:flavin-dependent dehydrogenase